MQRALIGFEEVFNQSAGTYPPYNVVKTETGFEVEVAVSGFDRSDLVVKTDNQHLVITGTRNKSETRNYVVHSLAARNFQKRFYIADDLEVDGVKLANGLLTVVLKNRKPLHVEQTYKIA